MRETGKKHLHEEERSERGGIIAAVLGFAASMACARIDSEIPDDE